MKGNILIILVFFVLNSFSSYGQSVVFTPAEKLWLSKNQDQIIYAPTPAWPPEEFIDEAGNHKGIIADYIHLFEKKLGVKFKIAILNDWDQVVNGLISSKADLIGGIMKTPEREKHMIFTKPFLEIPLVILVRNNYTGTLSDDWMKKIKLAGVKNYSNIDYVRKTYGNNNILECSDDLTSLLQTSLGHTDGTIIDLMTASYLVEKYGINNLRIGTKLEFTWSLSFACRKENKELCSIIDKVLSSIDDQQRKEIYSKWVNITIPDTSYKKNPRIMLLSVVIILLVFVVITTYNVILRRRVKKKTADLKHELEEKNQAIQLIHKNEMRLESLFAISQLKLESIEKLLDHSLKEAVRLTDSKKGVLYFFNETEELFVLSNYYQIDEQSNGRERIRKRFKLIESGDCGNVLRKKIAFLTNPHKTCRRCIRENCIFMPGDIDNSLFIPVIDDNDDFVAVLSVANKETEYNKSDARQLSLLFNSVWKIVNKQRWQEQLIAAKEKAEEGDRLKSAFLANMSHEIRTPMNAIVGFASFLKNEDLTSEQINKYCSIIINSSNQLLNIVNDILEIARLETNQVNINLSRFDLHSVFSELSSLFSPKAKEKNLCFSVSLPAEGKFIINSDETKLKQILYNLAGNAIKYTDNGKVEVGFESTGNFLKFFVKDTGIGIDPGMHEKIFERFRQVETSRMYGGNGLGLSISKAFVQLLGGEIWVESEPSIGSVFYFTLPCDNTKQTGNPTHIKSLIA